MNAYCITVIGDEHSEAGFRLLSESHEAVGSPFDLQRFRATTPDDVDEAMEGRGLKWTYPWEGYKSMAGLRCHRYVTHNRKARIACFMSHFRLWELAWYEPLVILEDDALFRRTLDLEPLLASDFVAIGLNDPRRATRLPMVFHLAVQGQPEPICEVPWIDEPEVPQGLAGASAYLMKPKGADMVMALARLHGAWPNDCLLVKQLMPGMLGVSKRYLTVMQGTPTTL